jgi:hypothetical protein
MFSTSEPRRSIARPATPFWVWLILGGIVLSTMINVVQDRAMRSDIDHPVGAGELLAYRPEPWALQLGRICYLLTFAGAALSLTAPSRIRMGCNYLILLCLSVAYSFVMAARNLQPADFLGSTFFSMMAPGCAIFSCLIFASADKEAWRTVVRTVAYGSLGISLIVLFEIVQLRSASRAEAIWRLYTYSSVLEISAIVALGWFAETRRNWLGLIPVSALIAASIAMQTRLMIVELVSLAFFYRLFSQRKLSSRAVVASCLVGLILLWCVYLAWYSPNALYSALPGSAAAFWDRATEDTRSAQFVNFFAKVPAETFLLGVGIPRPGEFNGGGMRGIDFGYVNILFLGGIPCLVLFFLLHQLPAIRCIGAKFDSLDAACLASIMTYGVRLLSSTVPNPSPGYYILMLLVGRSIMLVQERNRRFVPAYYAPRAGQLLENQETVAIAGRISRSRERLVKLYGPQESA